MITEVAKNLYVGNQEDTPNTEYIINAAKFPWHRDAVGYSGAKAPKGDEYFFAYRNDGKELNLNLIDPPDEKYISRECIREAMKFIMKNIGEHKVLIRCNQGKSRSPSLAFMYMKMKGLVKDLAEFKKIYPDFEPGEGFKILDERVDKGNFKPQ